MKHTLALVLMVFGIVGCSKELSYQCGYNEVIVSNDRNYVKIFNQTYYKEYDYGRVYLYGDKKQSFSFYPKEKRLEYGTEPTDIQKEFGKDAKAKAGVIDCKRT